MSTILSLWFLSFFTASIGGFLYGFDIGSSSSVIRILVESNDPNDTIISKGDSFEIGLIASGSLVGAIISSFIIVCVGDANIGRKQELIIAAICYTVGTIIESIATTFQYEMVGRIIYGLGIGIAMHVAPLYIGETSIDHLRGKLISFKEAMIVLGMVVGYFVGYIFAENSNWRFVFASALPFELIMLVGVMIVPESPRWLALRGRYTEAEESLQKLQGINPVEAKKKVQEMTEMSQTRSGSPSKNIDSIELSPSSKLYEIFSSPINRRALMIGLGLVFFQQLSGQPSVLYFANRIFEQAGLGFQAAVGVGLFKLVMTTVSAYLVEHPEYGRRSLLLIGNTGVMLSLFCLSILYSPWLINTGEKSIAPNDGTVSTSQWAIMFSMFIFVGAYQIGFGPLTWLVLSEIFPLRVRSVALSLGTLANFSSNLIVTLSFESERILLGEMLLFFQFALIALGAVIFTYYYVFETRGLSLEQIEIQLRKEVGILTIEKDITEVKMLTVEEGEDDEDEATEMDALIKGDSQ